MNTITRLITKQETTRYTPANELPYTANSQRGQLETQKKQLEDMAKRIQAGMSEAGQYVSPLPFTIGQSTAVAGFEAYVNSDLAQGRAKTYMGTAEGELRAIAARLEKVQADIRWLTNDASKLQAGYIALWQWAEVSKQRMVYAPDYTANANGYLLGYDAEFNKLMAETNGIKTNGCIGQ